MFNIRDMRLEDLSQLDMILHAVSSDWTIAILKDCFQENYFHWVICSNDNIAGFIVIKNNIDAWEILQIVIDGRYQRQGLGTQLLEYAVKQAKNAGIHLIQLEVRRSNKTAIALYRRCGFCEVGVRKKYYADGEDAVLMDKINPPA